MASNTELPPDWISASRLWLVLDQQAAAPRNPEQICRLCIPAGVDAVLCRLRGLSDSARLELAMPARQACLENGVPFVVSHDLQLARSLAADAVQFGKADGGMEELAGMAGQGMPWGYSSHSLHEAFAALEAGAAWVFLGPVFETPEKLQYGAPLGLEVVKQAMGSAQASRIICIGGIHLGNLPQLIAAGARRMAAIGALQRCEDPAEAARELRAILAAAEAP